MPTVLIQKKTRSLASKKKCYRRSGIQNRYTNHYEFGVYTFITIVTMIYKVTIIITVYNLYNELRLVWDEN